MHKRMGCKAPNEADRPNYSPNSLEKGMHKRMGCKAPNGADRPNHSPNSLEKGMHKRMGCKADDEVKYRSNLMVVRILTRHPTKQTAF